MPDTAVGAESIPASKQARWRDAFHKDEVLQRVRPQESQDYLPNPHRGTTTFQRFNGDDLYPGLHWDDSKGPLEFPPFSGDPLSLHNPKYPDTTLSYCRWLWSIIDYFTSSSTFEPRRSAPSRTDSKISLASFASNSSSVISLSRSSFSLSLCSPSA